MKDLRLIVILIVVVFCIMFFVNCKTTGNGDDNGNGNGNGNGGDNGTPATEAIIIDHTCTDLSQIPIEWINKVKEQLDVHYAHTSHGEQIVIGLERLGRAAAVYRLEMTDKSTPSSSTYNFWYDNCNVPSSTTHLTMMDGQYYDDYCETYVSPDLYWESDYGMTITRSVLNNFNVNISLWAWCSQQDYFSQAETQLYLDRMSQLETEFPDVTFIYMTGNAQSADQNRLDRNNQVRNYCKDNKKILFDFADLDCWYNGEQYTENGIPTEHPHYHGDQAGHTTYNSCENKGKAFWWLLARIAGWVPGGDSL